MPGKLKRIVLATAMAVMITMPSGAAEVKQAMNNMSHEYARCAAYFLVVSIAMENSSKPDLATQYKQVSENAFGFASAIGEGAGLLAETTTARFEQAFTEMTKRIAGNTSNVSILGNDYAEPCQVTMENGDNRLKFWMAQ